MIKKEKLEAPGWLDGLAVGMALLCAVHCLLVPVLIVSVPLISTTFFVNEDFHLWMLFAVFPTTLASIYLGCRKHKDRWVWISCFIGLTLLVVAFFQGHSHGEVCPTCSSIAESDHGHTHELEGKNPITNIAIINSIGGAFLILAHARNFYLCRKSNCKHNECEKDSCAD